MKRTAAFLLCFLLVAVSVPPRAVAKSGGGISAKAYILMEAATGRILAAANENTRLPIASTTKILTALITLEQPSLDSYFTVNADAIKVEGSSMGLREGDSVSLNGLATGMLLASGNDAANAAAVKIAGSIEKFSGLMNQKAKELGMENSHFVTPSGLPNDDHYSTAADMALLARHALQNERFAAICTKSSAKLSFGNPPFDRWLYNHNRLLEDYPGCIGIKTGFTKKAGRCLVSAARRDGVTLICVTLSDPNDWRDHAALLDTGFAQTEKRELSVSTQDISLDVVGGMQDRLAVEPLAPVYSCVLPEQEKTLVRTVCVEPFYYAPVHAGDIVGEIRYYYNGFEVASADLVAADDVPADLRPRKKSIFDKIKDFLSEHFRMAN